MAVILALLLPLSGAAADFVDGQPADLVLGQPDFTDERPRTSRQGMAGPAAVAIDPTTGKLFVADTQNNRVLRFPDLDALRDGEPAEIVLGQRDFESADRGLGEAGLSGPRGLVVDGKGDLYVADTGNRRVLRFARASSASSGAAAAGVYGQPDFESDGDDAMVQPLAVVVYAGGLLVADAGRGAVLLFLDAGDRSVVPGPDDGIPTQAAPASLALAQDLLFIGSGEAGRPIERVDLSGGLRKGFGPLGPRVDAGLPWGRVFGLATDDGERLFVSDLDNHRILVIDQAPTQRDPVVPAVVLGQRDPASGEPGSTAATLRSPLGLAYQTDRAMLLAADGGNHRVLRYTVGASAGAPDLVAAETAADPTQVLLGGAIDLAAIVANDGTAPADETSARFYRSLDATISPADQAISDPLPVPGLGVGDDAKPQAPWTPQNPGSFFVGLCVVPLAAESNTANNCTPAVPVTVTGGPNLVAADPSLDRAAVAPGEGFELSLLVSNDGDVASAATELRYFRSADATITLADFEIGSSPLAPIDPGADAPASAALTIDASGRFFVGACVISVPDESTIADNCTAGLAMDVFRGPDLAVAPPQADPAQPFVQDALTLSSTARNDGDEPSAATTLRFFAAPDSSFGAGTVELGSGVALGALDPGQAAPAELAGAGPLAAGLWFLRACVDTVAGEADPADDCSAATQLQVKQGPDLAVSDVSVSPASPAPGDPIVLSAKVSNAGDTAAEATTLQFYYSTDPVISSADTAIAPPAVVGALAAGGFEFPQRNAVAPAAGTWFFGACASAVSRDANAANDCSPGVQVVIDDGTGARLELAFDAFEAAADLVDNDGDGEPSPGDALRFALTLANTGAAAAANVVLTVAEPLGGALVPGSVSTTSGTVAGGNAPGDAEVRVEIATLPADGTARVAFELALREPFNQPTGSLAVAASAAGDEVSTVGDQLAVAVSAAPEIFAELIPELLVDNDKDGKANPTDVIRYTVRIRNDGDQAADRLVFSLAPPLEALLLSVSVQQGANVVLPSSADPDRIRIEFASLDGNSVRVDFDFDLAVIGLPVDGSRLLGVQGEVTGQNFSAALTDDPRTPAAADPTVLPLGELRRVAASCEQVGLILDPGARYGAASVLSDRYVVVGAPDFPSPRGSGVVVVYAVVDGELVCDAVIEVPENFTAEEFGAALDIDGDTLVVGAPGPVSAQAKNNGSAMQAAIFQRLGQSWSLKAPLTGTGSGGDDGFGASVAIEGSSVAVGAPDDAENETIGTGAAYMFDFNGFTAEMTDKVKPTIAGAPFPAKFGTAVDTAGGIMAVGSPGSPIGSSAGGSVSLFESIGGNLSPMGPSLAADDSGGLSGNAFGKSLALTSDMLAIGAPGDQGGAGAVYAYALRDNQLSSVPTTTSLAPGSALGESVAMDGDTIVAGAPSGLAAVGGGVTGQVGVAFQFALQGGGGFQQVGEIGAFPGVADLGEVQHEGFGSSVGVFGGSIVVGAPQSGSATGAAAVRLALPEGELIFFSGFEPD